MHQKRSQYEDILQGAVYRNEFTPEIKPCVELVNLGNAAITTSTPSPAWQTANRPATFPEMGICGAFMFPTFSTQFIMCCDMVVIAYTTLPTTLQVNLNTTVACQYWIDHNFTAGLNNAVVAGVVSAAGAQFYLGQNITTNGNRYYFVVPAGAALTIVGGTGQVFNYGLYVMSRVPGRLNSQNWYSINKWDGDKRIGTVTSGGANPSGLDGAVYNSPFALVDVEPYRMCDKNSFVWMPTAYEKQAQNVYYSTFLPMQQNNQQHLGGYQFVGNKLVRPQGKVFRENLTII